MCKAVFMVCGIAILAVLATGAVADTDRTYKDAEYVGSKACKACHKVTYDSWAETYHSKMVRTKDDGILKAAVEKWDTDGTTPGPKKANVTGKEFKLDDVQYVVGSYWKQRFLVKNEVTGFHQFMDKQFNRMSEKWENYGNKNDWETNCVTCHATGVRILEYDPKNPPAQKIAWTEENTGCETCHGPGAKHVKGDKKGSMWNPAKQSKAEQTRVCGYCHQRVENEHYKTAQGNNREDLPAPKIGETFKPWDDWTKWYPEGVVIPGVQPEDPFNKEYAGDLKGLFILDEQAMKSGVYDSGKHHQEFQEFIQSKHYKNGKMSCTDCHTPHKGKNIKPVVAKETCKKCHGDTYDYAKIMPGSGSTAANLTVRTHTFFKDQARPSKPTASGAPVLYKDSKK